jgi:hypothetical protein
VVSVSKLSSVIGLFLQFTKYVLRTVGKKPNVEGGDKKTTSSTLKLTSMRVF